MNKYIFDLHKLGKTVITTQDLAYVFGASYETIRAKISYYCRAGYLRRIHSGMFVLPGQLYSPREIAGQLLRPSYISLGSVLYEQGVIFQMDQSITVISYKTTSYTIDAHRISVRSIHQNILLNDAGIIQMPGYAIAIRERALLDTLYLSGGKNIHFDNLGGVDQNVCQSLLPLYQSDSLARQYHSLFLSHAR